MAVKLFDGYNFMMTLFPGCGAPLKWLNNLAYFLVHVGGRRVLKSPSYLLNRIWDKFVCVLFYLPFINLSVKSGRILVMADGSILASLKNNRVTDTQSSYPDIHIPLFTTVDINRFVPVTI